MATRKKEQTAVAEELAQETAEDIVKEPENEADALAAKDAEIARLKAQLEKRSSKESDFDRVHRLEAEAAAEGKDPWTITVEVLVPHREKSEDPWYWINVNGRSAQIPANDRYQEMKLPWACVLVDLLKANRRAIDYQESLEVFDPVNNPHR